MSSVRLGTAAMAGGPRRRAPAGGILVAPMVGTLTGCTPDRPTPHDAAEALDLSEVPLEGSTDATALVPAEAQTLRDLMRAVVTEGSGDFLADAPGEPVAARSGTAQLGTEGPPRNHAWMIAPQGDLALAVSVEEGDFGSTTSGPLLEAFLRGAAA